MPTYVQKLLIDATSLSDVTATSTIDGQLGSLDVFDTLASGFSIASNRILQSKADVLRCADADVSLYGQVECTFCPNDSLPGDPFQNMTARANLYSQNASYIYCEMYTPIPGFWQLSVAGQGTEIGLTGEFPTNTANFDARSDPTVFDPTHTFKVTMKCEGVFPTNITVKIFDLTADPTGTTAIGTINTTCMANSLQQKGHWGLGLLFRGATANKYMSFKYLSADASITAPYGSLDPIYCGVIGDSNAYFNVGDSGGANTGYDTMPGYLAAEFFRRTGRRLLLTNNSSFGQPVEGFSPGTALLNSFKRVFGFRPITVTLCLLSTNNSWNNVRTLDTTVSTDYQAIITDLVTNFNQKFFILEPGFIDYTNPGQPGVFDNQSDTFIQSYIVKLKAIAAADPTHVGYGFGTHAYTEADPTGTLRDGVHFKQAAGIFVGQSNAPFLIYFLYPSFKAYIDTLFPDHGYLTDETVSPLIDSVGSQNSINTSGSPAFKQASLVPSLPSSDSIKFSGDFISFGNAILSDNSAHSILFSYKSTSSGGVNLGVMNKAGCTANDDTIYTLGTYFGNLAIYINSSDLEEGGTPVLAADGNRHLILITEKTNAGDSTKLDIAVYFDGSPTIAVTTPKNGSTVGGPLQMGGTADTYLSQIYLWTSKTLTSGNASDLYTTWSVPPALSTGTSALAATPVTSIATVFTLTDGASGGTQPWHFQVQTSPHGADTWSNKPSAFDYNFDGSLSPPRYASAFSGFSPATTYDVRFQITDSTTPTPNVVTSDTISFTTPASPTSAASDGSLTKITSWAVNTYGGAGTNIGINEFIAPHVPDYVNDGGVSSDGKILTTAAYDETQSAGVVFQLDPTTKKLSSVRSYPESEPTGCYGHSKFFFSAGTGVGSWPSDLTNSPEGWSLPSPYTSANITGMAWGNNDLYLVDNAGAQVVVISDDINSHTVVRAFPVGVNPGKAIVDNAGNLWVVEDRYNGNGAQRLAGYSSTGTFLGSVPGYDSTYIPSALAIDPNGYLAVADYQNDSKIRFWNVTTPATPTLVKTFGASMFDPATYGLIGSQRFFDIEVMGWTSNGELLLAMNSASRGVLIQAYDSSGTLLDQLHGLARNIDNARLDPNDQTAMYSGDWEYTFDASKSLGKEAVPTYITGNKRDIPDDPKWNNGPVNVLHQVVSLGGKTFLVNCGLDEGSLVIYRKGNHSTNSNDLARWMPAVWINSNATILDAASWPAHRPTIGSNSYQSWIWTDKNADGIFNSGEYEADPLTNVPSTASFAANVWQIANGAGAWDGTYLVFPGASTQFIDSDGDIWQCNPNIFRRFPYGGLDSNGVPQYTFATATTYLTPAAVISNSVKSIRYDNSTDSMYFIAASTTIPIGIWRYDGWKAGTPILNSNYPIQILPNLNQRNPDAQQYVAFDLSGGHIFLGYIVDDLRIWVYNKATGAFEGTLNPDQTLVDVATWIDSSSGLQVDQLSDTSYAIKIENDHYNCVVMLRWPVISNNSGSDGLRISFRRRKLRRKGTSMKLKNQAIGTSPQIFVKDIGDGDTVGYSVDNQSGSAGTIAVTCIGYIGGNPTTLSGPDTVAANASIGKAIDSRGYDKIGLSISAASTATVDIDIKAT